MCVCVSVSVSVSVFVCVQIQVLAPRLFFAVSKFKLIYAKNKHKF